MSPQIRGLEEALATLQQIDPVLYREGQKNMRRDIRPLVDEARSMTPKQTPLSGWKEGGGSGFFRTGAQRFPSWEGNAQRKINPRIRREKIRGMQGRRVLVRVVQGSASGEAFDMAGRIRPGNPIDKSLQSAGFGTASRAMWPAAEKKLPEIQKSVQKSVFDMEDVINEALRAKGYSERGARMIARSGFAR